MSKLKPIKKTPNFEKLGVNKDNRFITIIFDKDFKSYTTQSNFDMRDMDIFLRTSLGSFEAFAKENMASAALDINLLSKHGMISVIGYAILGAFENIGILRSQKTKKVMEGFYDLHGMMVQKFLKGVKLNKTTNAKES